MLLIMEDFKKHGDLHHNPKFIIVEEEVFKGHTNERYNEKDDELKSFEKLKQVKYPILIRIICFFFTLLAFFSALSAFLGVVISLILTLITLGKYPQSQVAFRQCINWLKKSLVFLLGCSIAIFSPHFGFVLIVVYFLILGEKLDNQFIRRVVDFPKS